MSFFSRFFGKKEDDDYEGILSRFAADIQKRQLKLSEIRLRERRATLLATMYTLAGYVTYVALWYANILPGSDQNAVQKAVRGVPIVLGPIVILFIRRIVQIWYTRIGDAEEKTLQQLMKQQKVKVEEIKKKTNYYTTRDLLQRYDESAPATPVRQRLPTQQPPASTPQQQTPQQRLNASVNGRQQTPISQNLQAQLAQSGPMLTPPGPPRKQWFDKLADAVLGDDDSARFALICEKCSAHNGLVKESVWDDTQYVCPNCKHFNPSRRSKKQGTASPSPTVPKSAPKKQKSPLGESVTSSPSSPQGKPSDDESGDSSMMEVDEDS